MSNDGTSLALIKSFLGDLSLYQPFYPETFYLMWEFLQMKHVDFTSKNFLHIGRENSQGAMEAIIFYHEKYQHTYQQNIYHSWLTGKEMYDYTNGSYSMLVPEINYLEQAYKIKFIKTTHDLVKYNCISIDCNHTFGALFGWTEEELDLHANLFYILTAMQYLANNGSMIIKLNMIAGTAWYVIFDIVQPFFREYTFIRPAISHPFNSEIYLFLNKFEYSSSINTISNRMYKNLYRQRIYQRLYLNPEINTKNPITIKYQNAVNAWTKKVLQTAKNFDIKHNNKSIDYIGQWHASNDLKQIKHLTNKFDDNTMQCELKSEYVQKSVKMPTLKPLVSTIWYDKPVYKKITDKRSDLNYYKRVMDTKPSQIFSGRRYDVYNYLLTWEQLTYSIDIHKNLKKIFINQYQAEMVTNAWIKMYEILNSVHDLIPLKENIKTFHLCEAPGAFISAVNHYISNRGIGTLNWYAQSLKPNNTIKSTNELDVRDLALDVHRGLIGAYPNRWLFGDGSDKTGDITHSAVIKSYVSNPLLKDIDFMTSDAGLQCDPTELNEQEAFLSKINMGQIVCILACLPIGKSAIFKTFLPMSEPLTISMMYLVTNLFGTVTIIKPSSSHSSNSEVYVVLKKYKGIGADLLEILYGLLDDPKITSKTRLFEKIDKVYFDSYMESITRLIDRQIQALCRNYYYYYHLSEIENFKNTIDKCTEDWLNKNPVFVLKNKLIHKTDTMVTEIN